MTTTVKTAIFLMATAIITSCGKAPQFDFQTAVAEKQDITTSITATGTIEPVTQVEVGTQVSGIIAHIYVDYNSIVKKGDIIAELDKTNLLSELSSAESNLENAQNTLSYQTNNYNRYKTLYDKGLVSADDYENARLSYDQARQQLNVQQQNVQKARTNLGYATITAPIDGVVLSKEVEEGQTVASAMTTPTLFIIAKDLTDMRVIANIDEADIGGVREGQRVTFTVDAYPDDVFHGNVTQVRQQAIVESNVVTYEVVISAPNEELKLKPGLTANVTIMTLEKKAVLAIPAKALRFAPSEAMLQEGETIIPLEPQTVGSRAVWVKEDKTLKAYPVVTGTSNGTLTEIVSGIDEGQEIIVEFSAPGIVEEQNNIFMPRRPSRNDKKK